MLGQSGLLVRSEQGRAKLGIDGQVGLGGPPHTAAVASTIPVLFQQLSSGAKLSGELHWSQGHRELLEAAGWAWVSIHAQGTMGSCPPALGSCQWWGLPAPGLGGRGGRVLAHPRGQVGGGVAAGQGIVNPWTRMLHATHCVQMRMPRQEAWCLQSGLCLCWAWWQGRSHGSYPLVKIHFFSLFSSHAREPQGRFSVTDT